MKFKTPGQEPMSIALTTGDTIVVSPEGTELPVQFRKEAIARGCVPVGINTEGEPPKREPSRDELVAAGIEKLLESDEEDAFGKDGKPAVAALSKVVGFSITAADRDAAWEKFEAELKAADKGGE